MTPTAEDLVRNLVADLAVCESAPPGPLYFEEPRSGWPAAIRRALAAEAERDQLRRRVAELEVPASVADWRRNET